jgi:DNA repair protein RadC
MPRKPSVIRAGKDVYEAFKGIARYRKERVYSLLLDEEGNILGKEEMARGWACGVDALPDVVFGSAWIRKCSSMIIVLHNHPSGIPEPSADDFNVTRNLYMAGKRRGVEISDSVIIAAGG